MKDKRTYNKLKEHGEDMTHENEVKTTKKPDSSVIAALTEQYKAEIFKYKERESLHIKTQNQLDATKAIVMEMAGTIREVHTQNENLRKEIERTRRRYDT